MKRLKHPEHGFHHAYTPEEEADMRAQGWVDEDQSFAAPQASEEGDSLAPSSAPVGAASKRKYVRRAK